jgi:hypothetical protein
MFHYNNDELTIHQSTIMWFKCVNGVRENMIATRGIQNGPVEAKNWLTFAMAG